MSRTRRQLPPVMIGFAEPPRGDKTLTGHAPASFRRMLNRLHRAKQKTEVARYGEVVTRKPPNAAWEYW